MAGPRTATFNYTGGQQSWVVPAKVVKLASIVAKGAGGASTTEGLGPRTLFGGRGSWGVLTDYAVSQGQTLYVYVGGKGTPGQGGVIGSGTPGTGGYNGGGNGGVGDGGTYNMPGAGGGGASDVRVGGTGLGNRIVVGGGGGGAHRANPTGTDTGGNSSGGDGGYTTGGEGGYGSSPSYGLDYGGQGGTQSAGGAGGVKSIGSDVVGNPGSSGQGGAGGSKTNTGTQTVYGGGGGGGGYYGGGGGIATEVTNGQSAASGGGGSSYPAEDGVNSTDYDTDGQVVITYYLIPNATQLQSPVGGAIVTVSPSRSITLDWLHLHDDFDPQQRYALRRRRPGGSYEYWNNATGLWQGTIVWNASGTTQKTFTYSQWAGTKGVWEWSAATSSQGGDGPFAADATFDQRDAVDADASTLTGGPAGISAKLTGWAVDSFTNTSSEQTWEVPVGVTRITVHAAGSSGGTDALPDYKGYGSRAWTHIDVTPGQVLAFRVGTRSGSSIAGTNASRTSLNGGNGGSAGIGGAVGGGGGAGTYVTLAGSDLLIAAGGGGASGGDGPTTGDDTPGGDGSYLDTATGEDGSGGATKGGNGATQSTNGTGGSGSLRNSGQGGSTTLGGGDGGNGSTTYPNGGGGGGGGYRSGGGGASGGGGGAGASWIASTPTSLASSYYTNEDTLTGFVKIYYLPQGNPANLDTYSECAAVGQARIIGQANLSADGTLTADAQVRQVASADLDGDGTLGPVPSTVTTFAQADLVSDTGTTGIGFLVVIPAPVTLDGDADLTIGDPRVRTFAEADLTGDGTLTASGVRTRFSGPLTLFTRTTLAASGGLKIVSDPVTLDGDTDLTAVGTRTLPGAATLDGAPNDLVASAQVKVASGPLNLYADGTLAADGWVTVLTEPITYQGQSELFCFVGILERQTSDATLDADGYVRVLFPPEVYTAEATLTAAGAPMQIDGQADLTELSTLDAEGMVVVLAGASLPDGDATLAATGTVRVPGVATLEGGPAEVTADAHVTLFILPVTMASHADILLLSQLPDYNLAFGDPALAFRFAPPRVTRMIRTLAAPTLVVAPKVDRSR